MRRTAWTASMVLLRRRYFWKAGTAMAARIPKIAMMIMISRSVNAFPVCRRRMAECGMLASFLHDRCEDVQKPGRPLRGRAARALPRGEVSAKDYSRAFHL